MERLLARNPAETGYGGEAEAIYGAARGRNGIGLDPHHYSSTMGRNNVPSSSLMCYPCTVEYVSFNPGDPDPPRVRYATTVGPVSVGGAVIAVPMCNQHVPAAQAPPTREQLLAAATEQAEAAWRQMNPGQEPPQVDPGVLRPAGRLAVATGSPDELRKLRGGNR